MKKYSKKTIASIKSDRKKGLSIQALVQKHNIPKTSVWHHVKSIKLNAEQKAKIALNQGGSKVRKERDIKLAGEEAKTLIQYSAIQKYGILILAALYWAEGHKDSLVFTNTDPDMIKIFIKLVKEILKIQNKDMVILVRITDHMDPNKCLSYWQKTTGLPKKNIRVNINILHNKTRTEYGICRIMPRKGGYKLKIMNAMIEKIKNAYL